MSPYSAHRKCLSHKPKCRGYDRQVLLICLKTGGPRKTTKWFKIHPNTANSKENSNDLRVCKYATCLATSIFSRKGAQHPKPRPLLGFYFPKAMGQQVLPICWAEFLQRSKSWVCSQHPWFFRSSLSQDLCPPCPSAQGVGFTQKESGRYSCSPWPVLVFIEEIWLEDIYIYIYLYLSIYLSEYIRYQQHPGKFRDLVFPQTSSNC